jgi:hypothetical protein
LPTDLEDFGSSQLSKTKNGLVTKMVQRRRHLNLLLQSLRTLTPACPLKCLPSRETMKGGYATRRRNGRFRSKLDSVEDNSSVNEAMLLMTPWAASSGIKLSYCSSVLGRCCNFARLTCLAKFEHLC